MSEANKIQIGGKHYSTAEGEQHWDRVHRLGLDYFQAQITKYVERCWEKGGIQDLMKARHFIDKYMELSAGRQGRAERAAAHQTTELLKAQLELPLTAMERLTVVERRLTDLEGGVCTEHANDR
jgi:hypothetical protein